MQNHSPKQSVLSSGVRLLRSRALCLLLAAALNLLCAHMAHAGGPGELLRSAVSDIVAILTDSAYDIGANSQARYTQLRATADRVFGWREMVRRSLGYHWRSLSSEQRDEFMETFAEYLARVYLEKIDAYLEGRPDFSSLNIEYAAEQVEGSHARIETVIHSGEKSHRLEYRLLRTNDVWRVYDVIIDRVGLVANYRAQFNEIPRNSSVEKLLQKLRDKLERYQK